MDERLAQIFRTALACAESKGSISFDEWYDASNYIAENED